jgi:hypothetical protein
MTASDSPVGGKNSPQYGRRPGGKGFDVSRIAAELRVISGKALTDLLQRFFVVVDDELFKRSDKQDSSADQSLYFNEMRQFRVESAALQAGFERRLQEDLDAFWAAARGSNPDVSKARETREFSLLENDALEEEIAVSAMIQKGNKLFQDQLSGLAQRFALLIDRDELDFGDLPASPDAVCRAFSGAIKPLGSDLVVKLLIYKLFDRVVLSALGPLYGELNNKLVAEGVLPNLPKFQKRGPAGAAGPGSMSPLLAGMAADGGDFSQVAYQEVFQGMQRLLDGWRAQMGMVPIMADGAGIRGPAFDTGDVLNALNVLQGPEAGYGEAPPGVGEGLKLYVASQLAQSHPGESRPLGRQEEDIIDMVALIFDFILDDRNLPDAVKGLIARLQIPVIKVAIIEKSFFGRKNHPVRLLLNSLAQAGIGLDSSEDIVDSAVYKKIENIVTRILDEFDQNVGLFSDLLDEFITFLERDAQRSRVAEERTRQVTQSREQLHLAKRKIAYEIATRLEGKATPAAVRSFLYNTWKDVLVLSYLRRDKQPRDWDNALLVMDKLIWSVAPVADSHERKAIIQMIPRLLKAIRVGLESISMDPQTVAAAIKELEHCHVSKLSIQPYGAPGSEPSPAPAAERDAAKAVEIRDPELAEAIKEIKANLPEVQGLTANDLAGADVVVVPMAPAGAVDDTQWSRASALEVGSWVEFDEGGKQVRGKLSWKSQVTSNYIFVNRKGAKILEIGLEELARRLSEDSARVIEGTDVPLMDRAFGALLHKLNSPISKPA